MITREEVIDELASLGISGSDVYLLDVIALVEMIWADGEVQKSELDILDEYMHMRVRQINELVNYEMMDFPHALAFARGFIDQKPSPELLAKLRSLVGPIIFTSSDARYVDALLKSLLEACIDIAANAVCNYPYDMHGRFDSREKACFFDILKTLMAFRWHDKVQSSE